MAKNGKAKKKVEKAAKKASKKASKKLDKEAKKLDKKAIEKAIVKEAAGMSVDDHRALHMKLHAALDILLADWMYHTGTTVTDKTVGDLMKWSNEQCRNPTVKN